jgi:hypothetical protein
MTRKLTNHWYIVEGRGQFPEDMLRRDGSAFATALDYTKAGDERGTRRVMLATNYDRPRHWFPLDARWRSFGWKVVEHNGEAVDLSPTLKEESLS